MRVLIDASPLLLRSAGVKNFVYYWLAHLQREAPESISFFPFLRELGSLDHEASIAGRFGTRARLQFMGLANREGSRALDFIVGGRYDVFHASQHTRNPPRGAKLTATIYDMTCWLLPQMHTPENVQATREYAQEVLRRADGVIAISKCTRDDAARILGLAPERIEVIYPGVSDAFSDVPESDTARVRQKYQIHGRYLMFAGCIEPRKNLARLLDAWEMLSPGIRSGCEMIVVGPMGWEGLDVTSRLTGASGGVRYLGYVPELDLPALVAGATALVYPSLYEGFGFPVVQAMAAGTPVITSNVSSLPEIAADAALLINPASTEQISHAMRQILESSGLCAELRRRGLERARAFRWEDCARKSLAFFSNVIAGQAPLPEQMVSLDAM